MYGRVTWVGEGTITCQMGRAVCMDLSNGWGSVYGCVKWVGEGAIMCQMGREACMDRFVKGMN